MKTFEPAGLLLSGQRYKSSVSFTEENERRGRRTGQKNNGKGEYGYYHNDNLKGKSQTYSVLTAVFVFIHM